MSGFDDWLGRNIPDDVMEDAASWMALLDSANCTAQDREDFANWLGSDPLHQGAFEELSEVWARLHVLSDVPRLRKHRDVIPFPAQPEAVVFRDEALPARTEWSALVASVLVILGLVFNLGFEAPSDVHVTGIGDRESFLLDDGSRVDLNARSSLEVQLDDKRREIRLRDGEAVFHVVEDSRPFVVRTDLATVSAVGTEFSVRADSALVEISVIEGLVSVAATRSDTALTEYESDLLMRFSDEIALLGAGQRLELTRESKRYESVPEGGILDSLSWREGQVVFSDTPLVAAIADMRRYHRIRISIADPALNSLRISGHFRVGDAEGFLRALDEKYGISIDRVDSNFVVLRSR